MLSLIENSPSVRVLKQAFYDNRLPHGVLLHGDNMETLEAVCLEFCKLLLNCELNKLTTHPDFFTLRPSNKMRQINAEKTRELIKNVQQSSSLGTRKAVVIYEADRMNATAANAFLKTLEEPAGDTTIFLLTTRPYNLLDTIRSRCFNFSLPATIEKLDDTEWQDWKASYTEWIEAAQGLPTSKPEVEKRVLGIYSLICRFEQILERLGNNAWKVFKEKLSGNITEEEEVAQQSGIEKGIRHRLFREIEESTRHVLLKTPNQDLVNKLIQAIEELERVTRLIEVNLNECTALEAFFFASLRIWSGVK